MKRCEVFEQDHLTGSQLFVLKVFVFVCGFNHVCERSLELRFAS